MRVYETKGQCEPLCASIYSLNIYLYSRKLGAEYLHIFLCKEPYYVRAAADLFDTPDHSVFTRNDSEVGTSKLAPFSMKSLFILDGIVNTLHVIVFKNIFY